MTSPLHAALVARAEEIDLQRMAAKASLKRLMEESAANPILNGAISGERYFSPDTTDAALKALFTSVSQLSGTTTSPVDLGHDFRSCVDVPHHRRDDEHLIRDGLLNALRKYPAERLQQNGQRQLRLKVLRALWLRPGCHSSPRMERAGWVIRMSGGHCTYSKEPRPNAALSESLASAIPNLLELICKTTDELNRELADYDETLRAWWGYGSPISRRILEDYPRIGFRVFKDKAEITISHDDAETLQLELAELIAQQYAA